MHGEVVTAIGGYGLELMVGEERAQLSSGGSAGAVEFVVGIFHLVHLEYCLQASFVEGGIVGYQGQPLYLGRNLSPDFREDICIHRVFLGQAVNPGVPIRIILRFGLDEAVVAVCNLAIPHYHNAHRADTCTLLVGRFEIYRCKIFHRIIIFVPYILWCYSEEI